MLTPTVTPSETANSPFRLGLRTGATALVGFVPFGLVIGAELAASSMPGPLAWSTNALVYGGTAQLLLARLFEAGSSLLAIAMAAIAVNGPLLAAGSDLAPDFDGERRSMRIAAAMMLVVPAWSVARATERSHATAPQRARHYLGVALAMFVGWQLVTTVGMVLAKTITLPPIAALAAPSAIIALLAWTLTSRSTVWAAVVSVAVTIGTTQVLPTGLDVLAGVIAGSAAGRVRS